MSLASVECLPQPQIETTLTPEQGLHCNNQSNLAQYEGRKAMIRTIAIGKYITAQGVFLRALPNGYIVIKAGTKELSGLPVSKRVA